MLNLALGRIHPWITGLTSAGRTVHPPVAYGITHGGLRRLTLQDAVGTTTPAAFLERPTNS
jgi:hypothetical protein